MKTPREILFKRHREVEPKLDAIRQKTLAGLGTAAAEDSGTIQTARRESPFRGAILRTAWIELILPYRRAWAGMAVLWLAVAAANVAIKVPFASASMARSAPAPDVLQAVAEQRRLLAELLAPNANAPAANRTEPKGQPRSERRISVKAC